MEYLTLLWRAILDTLQFNQDVFQVVINGWLGVGVAAGVAFLGGVSLLVGQSVILFVNRVRPPRFFASLLLNGVLYVGDLLVWAWAVRLAARLLLGVQIPLWESIALMFLTAAPMLFGFLILMPYLGPVIERLLKVWSFLLTYQLVALGYGINWWHTVWVVGAGWLMTLVLHNTVGWPLAAALRRLRNWVAGVHLEHSTEELVVKLSNLLVPNQEEISELGMAKRNSDYINTEL
ncbi:MAG: hypothetical protein KDE19_11680 [Caldilineaceae bacterium]|nr:hypothetical protein [Caldilineaceae bacterium]